MNKKKKRADQLAVNSTTMTKIGEANSGETQASKKQAKNIIGDAGVNTTENVCDLISYSPAWRKINFSSSTTEAKSLTQKVPAPKVLAPKVLAPKVLAASMLEADQLLRALNGGFYRAGGATWRCQAQILPSLEAMKQGDARALVQSLVITVGGAHYLLEASMPIALRQILEEMTEPFLLEELPPSIALGIISLKLQPLLRELLTAPASIVSYIFASSKNGKKESNLTRNSKSREKWLQEMDLSVEVELLPILEDGEGDNSREQFFFRLHLACSTAKNLCAALRQTRSIRRYPPNLHLAWSFYAAGTTISIEEFRALEEGDVLLLA